MNIKYLGTVGETADTPLGVKRTGEVFEVPDKQAPSWLSGGNFAKTDEPVTNPTEPTSRAGAQTANFPAHDESAQPGTAPVSVDKTTGPDQPTPSTITTDRE